ncbi:MAG: hypothetical protein C0184_14860, partial [Chloroflexus aggregans]
PADLIVTASRDDSIGADCTWLLLAQRAGLQLAYRETEGLEFETLDRYQDEVTTLGGPQAWLDRFDANLNNWLLRLELTYTVVESCRQQMNE